MIKVGNRWFFSLSGFVGYITAIICGFYAILARVRPIGRVSACMGIVAGLLLILNARVSKACALMTALQEKEGEPASTGEVVALLPDLSSTSRAWDRDDGAREPRNDGNDSPHSRVVIDTEKWPRRAH